MAAISRMLLPCLCRSYMRLFLSISFLLMPTIITHSLQGVKFCLGMWNRTTVIPSPKLGAIPLGDTQIVPLEGFEPSLIGILSSEPLPLGYAGESQVGIAPTHFCFCRAAPFCLGYCDVRLTGIAPVRPKTIVPKTIAAAITP